MDWITYSVVLLGCLLSLLSSVVEGATLTAEENSSVILPCTNGSVTDFIAKTWYRGYFNNTKLPPGNNDDDIIYNQIRSGTVNIAGARSDMSLDNTTFHLTIGRVQLVDDSYFTCRVSTLERTTFESTQLDVCIQPKITLTGLDTTTFTENTTVTVTCTIDRIYPELGPADFGIRWGEQGNASVGTIKADKSYMYTVQYTRTLTREDDGRVVKCRVVTAKGLLDEISKTITVQYISGDPAVLTVKPSNAFTEEPVTFTCGHGTAKDNPVVEFVIWYKDGKPLNDWPEKSLTHRVTVNTTHSGLYTCLVGNGVGYSTISMAMQLNVSAIINPVTPAPVSVLPAAIGGAVGGVVVIILIIVIFLCCRRSKKNSQDDKGSSTAALNQSNHQSLDRVVIPPDDNGEAQYSDIPPARTKPIPAQRSFRKKPEAKPRNPEPIYDVANVNTGTDNKVLYSNIAEANGIEPEYAQVSKPPKKPPRLSTGDNNNADNNQAGLVYADLNLEKARANREQRGIMPRQVQEPTEYAQIDFIKSGKR